MSSSPPQVASVRARCATAYCCAVETQLLTNDLLLHQTAIFFGSDLLFLQENALGNIFILQIFLTEWIFKIIFGCVTPNGKVP
jgi:hypothetical protein